jgi:hypothetical protein
LVFVQLLSQCAPFALKSFEIVFIINFDVIIFIGIARVETKESSGFDSLFFDDFFKHSHGCIVKFLCLFSNCLIIEDFWISSIWIFSSNLPRDKEWIPINVFYERS